MANRLPEPPPPIQKELETKTMHGVAIADEYAWLKAANWQEVLRDPAALPAAIRTVIDAENDFAARALEAQEPLRQALVKEMRGRIKEDDAEVPLRDGRFLYYLRYNEGGQHPIFCRSEEDGAAVETLLDGDAEGAGKIFFDIAEARHSPDHRKFAWSADENGSELHAIRVRDLDQGRDGADIVKDTDGSLVWTADSGSFYYVRVDEHHRPAAVFRHRLGEDPSTDALIFEERDPRWFIHVRRSQSGAFGIISVSDHDASECHLLDLHDPAARPRLIEPRAPGLRYEVEHRGDQLHIRANADGAEDFKIVVAPLATPAKAFWADEIGHKPGRMIIALSVFPEYLVRLEREEGLPRIVIRCFESGEEHAVAFAEEAYSLSINERLEFDTRLLRFTYSSMTTPRETYDYDLATGARVLRKRQTIPSGHDPAAYVTRRLFAPAADGELVPVSILYRRDLPLEDSAPVLLYGYGAYGHPTPASFSATRLSLVDRGFIYAIAHVRGGTEKGWRWYVGGKLANKPHSFSDFVAAARHLIAKGLTKEGRIVIQGGSAGGMLMGAAVNLAPDLFAGVIADVPFVDVLNTMLDAELPLTPPEWLEWGNPITDAEAFAAIRSYSPYDNIVEKRYPPILALGGLTDPRVTYWEPLKWTARLRATMTGGGPILCKINMGAGHGGAPGRFDRLQDAALQYAFALACVEGAFGA
ncbi:S9 family peptidase [Methylocella tundrae]|uniref:S9 family peptidase n=2 Tax=Methylocella tundrae TaxID=227605 RepID=A0A4U8Z4F3_METTU|nr:S9 family peptidase [Methylocella tundrae]WPP04098.1 S9 family peptidase [Methylocella tundrae]VFU10350.1 S9 family peptidase [Methylocella tundrae]